MTERGINLLAEMWNKIKLEICRLKYSMLDHKQIRGRKVHSVKACVLQGAGILTAL